MEMRKWELRGKKSINCALRCVLQEWNAPKPRHLSLLRSALERECELMFVKPASVTTNGQQSDLWAPLADQGWKPFLESINATSSLPQKSKGYLQVFLDGGLNQQRMGIYDAVAKILNATLVIPHLEVNPVWQDSSSFMDIFDVDHFINVLKDDISIVKELPDEIIWNTREYYATAVRATRIKRAPVHASEIAAISPFSHRLSFDNLPSEIQKLRCKVNFKALMFVPRIRALGDAIVHRLRYPPGESEAVSINYLEETTDQYGKKEPQKFVVLNLWFDKDMAAHSTCDFGGGKAEKLALTKYQQTMWGRRVLNSQFTDEELRSQGRCPLTPEEIGLLLAALGFDNSTLLYLASHKGSYKGRASLLAAVDYYVAMHSDIFVSASPGNMHNALVGHRTFENRKTIRPNMSLLGQLFLNKNITLSEFRQAVAEGHQTRLGQLRLRKPKQPLSISSA
ncbi:mechanosensitive ion channel protein 2 [Hibiscus syriacus]|uniref:O-fucosyltransferase family protein n=1 Tax=Hibiscus syriacus TaxID=106335 RepID=A0A6A2ZVI7_HIBSY|nr:mechanosensitive ion channel protein 2 [Hibiscus syriacus]